MNDGFDYSSLNPGIQRTVKWLRDFGFDTQDSGDGVTRQYDCDPGFPYVSITIAHSGELIPESHRLVEALRLIGVHVTHQDENGTNVAIQAMYDPLSESCEILLIGVTDQLLFDQPPTPGFGSHNHGGHAGMTVGCQECEEQ